MRAVLRHSNRHYGGFVVRPNSDWGIESISGSYAQPKPLKGASTDRGDGPLIATDFEGGIPQSGHCLAYPAVFKN